MNFDTPLHQAAWSLLIGAEVFAVAALWPLSEWAVARPRNAWLALAFGVAMACVAMFGHATGAPRALIGPPGWAAADGVLAWLVAPLFLALPGAVCIVSAQSLRLAGLSPKAARAVSLCLGGFGTVVAPLAGFGAACGLIGFCP
ncbi:MAG: hypothetical protein ABW032_06805 [Burkholderiaceae bacterium]